MPKRGREWPKNGFWPCQKNGGSMARKMGKMARNSIFEPFWAHFFHFPVHFSHFPGHFPPIFQVRPKSIFRPFSSPFRAGGPKWIYTRSTGFQNRGFNCEWFARIDSRESRCESPVPLSWGAFQELLRLSEKRLILTPKLTLYVWWWLWWWSCPSSISSIGMTKDLQGNHKHRQMPDPHPPAHQDRAILCYGVYPSFRTCGVYPFPFLDNPCPLN